VYDKFSICKFLTSPRIVLYTKCGNVFCCCSCRGETSTSHPKARGRETALTENDVEVPEKGIKMVTKAAFLFLNFLKRIISQVCMDSYMKNEQGRSSKTED